MNKKRLVITGNKGFLGSALENYLKKDYAVFGVDLEDGTDIFDMPSLMNIDTVIHCAARTSVKESIIYPTLYYQTNVLGTAHIANQCLKYHTQLFYISSAAMYDFDSSPYADSKSLATQMVFAMKDALRALLFVPYNIYATRPKAGSLFSRFLIEKHLEVDGNGEQTRDFINILDVCDIIKTALDEEWNCNIFNLGTGVGTSVNTIANVFHEETGKPIIYNQKDCGIIDSVADVEHLLKHYKKPLKTNLKKDIEKMILNFN